MGELAKVLEFPSVQAGEMQAEGLYVLPMAVGSGPIVVGQSCKLTLCPEIPSDPLEYAPRFMAFNADKTLWLRGTRTDARREGEDLHASRRQQLFEGNFSNIPLDVDAVGTAKKVSEIRRKYGVNSPEYKEAKQGLWNDYARKWAEAFRNNTWENFKRTVQRYDPKTDKLYADGLPVDDMVNNGITPVAMAEELDLRLNDKVTHETTKQIIITPNLPPTATLYIKPCPNYAHESYRTNPKSAHGGYAPAIDKLMVNLDFFDSETQEIYHDQLGVSGIYITPEVMQEVLFDLSIVSSMDPMSRTEIHGTLGVLQGEKLPSIDVIISLLDKKASEKSGKNIFLGEVVSENHPKDYQIIFTEAEMRQHQQVGLTNQLVEYVEKLEADGEDHAVATQMVEKFIQEKLLGIVEKDPSQAEIIFDKPTAERFHKARELEAQGRTAEADEMRAYARKNAPPSGSCGAGSCGLESGASLPQHVLDKLQAEAGDIILMDTERACTSCGEKTVVYAFNANKVNKYCTNCEAFESKQT